MTANARIALNVVATYGRSLYALVLGLFSSRWVLMSLGQVDFGLYGVVGGLTAFICFFNNLLSMAVVRFYAVSVGEANVAYSKDQGIEECRKWFSTAMLLHTVIPTILILIGYPIGKWAVANFLTIPDDRIADCIWVWRFTCFSCFVGMLNVPFQSMYTAKQEIAELTIYSFATTTTNFFFLYYMATHPSVWLARYAMWMCALSVIPSLIICSRAVIKYPECRMKFEYLWDASRMRQLLFYSSARFWTALSGMLSSQGQNIVVNKYLGPAFNASMTVGGQVTSHASTLSSAISGAFWPAIANTAGEGDVDKVKSLSFRVCKLSTLMVLIFIIPLSLEIDKVLRLWLKTPPEFASEICIAVMFGAICERITEGYWMAVMGVGKRVGYYSWIIGWTGFCGFFISFALLWAGLGLWGVCIAIVIAKIITICLRLYLGHVILGMSSTRWFRQVMLPLVILSVLTLSAGLPPRFFMQESFLRVCVTSASCVAAFILLSWSAVLSKSEKAVLVQKTCAVFGKHHIR